MGEPKARGHKDAAAEDAHLQALLAVLLGMDLEAENVMRRLFAAAQAFRKEAQWPPEAVAVVAREVMGYMEKHCSMPRNLFEPLCLPRILAVRSLGNCAWPGAPRFPAFDLTCDQIFVLDEMGVLSS